MPKKRVLSPKSIWDYEQVSEAFRREDIKEIHIQRLYTYVIVIVRPAAWGRQDYCLLDIFFEFAWDSQLITHFEPFSCADF